MPPHGMLRHLLACGQQPPGTGPLGRQLVPEALVCQLGQLLGRPCRLQCHLH